MTDSYCFFNTVGMAQDNRGVLLTMDLMNARAGECPVLYGVDDKTGKVLFQNEFATAKGVQNSKCYFMDCYDDTLVVSDLGTVSFEIVFFIIFVKLRKHFFGKVFLIKYIQKVLW